MRAVLDVLEAGNERVYRAEASPTEVQLWSVFRRHTLAMEWASEDERREAELAGHDLVVQKFLGVADTYVEGYAFEAYVNKVDKPDDIAIRYSIEPDG